MIPDLDPGPRDHGHPAGQIRGQVPVGVIERGARLAQLVVKVMELREASLARVTRPWLGKGRRGSGRRRRDGDLRGRGTRAGRTVVLARREGPGGDLHRSVRHQQRQPLLRLLGAASVFQQSVETFDAAPSQRRGVDVGPLQRRLPGRLGDGVLRRAFLLAVGFQRAVDAVAVHELGLDVHVGGHQRFAEGAQGRVAVGTGRLRSVLRSVLCGSFGGSFRNSFRALLLSVRRPLPLLLSRGRLLRLRFAVQRHDGVQNPQRALQVPPGDPQGLSSDLAAQVRDRRVLGGGMHVRIHRRRGRGVRRRNAGASRPYVGERAMPGKKGAVLSFGGGTRTK
mmetsp:Transcript_38301/g.89082  ORF Transcript_38301/g.89082 Transcript_38301/m.89082 type:complete len:337 (+) Transcript_38301:1193-2203(+)